MIFSCYEKKNASINQRHFNNATQKCAKNSFYYANEHYLLHNYANWLQTMGGIFIYWRLTFVVAGHQRGFDKAVGGSHCPTPQHAQVKSLC